MKIIVQRHAILLAALLQVLPIVRNFFINPATSSTFAFILRWGIGATAAVGAVDAVSGATNKFTSPGTFIGAVGTPFTNGLILQQSGTDNGAFTVITSNSVSVVITTSGVSTNFDIPPGLLLQFQDNHSGTNPVHDVLYGIPTTIGTNTFTVSLEYQTLIVTTNITVEILASGSILPPSITTQPAGITNLVGGNPNFSVSATPLPLNYQWFFNTNTALLNETNSTLTVTNAQPSQAGFYSVIVSNSSGAITSSLARLTLWQPPVITNQPAGSTNLAGSPASFSVVAGGTPVPKYNWLFNDSIPVANATNAILNIRNVHLSQAGTYSVIISNSAGSVTSSPVLLSVTVPPPPAITSIPPGAVAAGIFEFTFTPVAGLTNTVQSIDDLVGGSWQTLTTFAPPATTNTLTVTDPLTSSNRFYRVQIVP